MNDAGSANRLSALSDKALLEAVRNGSDDAAEVLTRRLFGKVTPAMRKAWPGVRHAKHLSVHAARRLLAQAESDAAAPATVVAPPTGAGSPDDLLIGADVPGTGKV